MVQIEVGPGGEPIEPNESLIEGAFRQIQINAYERNPIARRRCIEAHGHACVVCQFVFGSIYGPLAEGYIHVHHLVPLSQTGVEHEVDPANDLRPVCPNCHAVAHLRNPPYTIEELCGMLRRDSRGA
ncbi:MAG TPA: HNH endonuclease [Thermoanaerobaculia bacterium]|nr:HNH endonuclease [Thermoanaerobaculia bacterium]